VAKHCLEMGHEVLVFDDLSGGFQDQVPTEVTFVKGSINDVGLVGKLFSEWRFDYVYHLAAYAAEGLSHFIRRFNYQTNLIGTTNLINESIRSGVRCFVFTSSIAVYGPNQLPMTEDLTPRPEDPYGISKYAAELDLHAAFKMFGLPFIIFRPHNVYGEHQNTGDPYRNVLGIFISQIMNGEPLTIFGDGDQRRAFTHVDDVAPHIARSVQCEPAYNQVINIGSDVSHTVNELASIVAGAFGIPLEIRRLPGRVEVYHAYSNHERAASLLGVQPTIDLPSGIRRMRAWVREVGARKSHPFGHIEVTVNLPPSWAAFTGSR
jgi:UDP-glucose 4-epimerase